MGDILGAIFGTSSSTTQQTKPDVVQQAANLQKLNQLVNFFATGGVNQFAGGGPGDVYNPTDFSTDLYNIARNTTLDYNWDSNYDNLMSLADYQRSFDPVTDTYNNAIGAQRAIADTAINEARDSYNVARDINARNKYGGLVRSYNDFTTGATAAGGAYNTAMGGLDRAYYDTLARSDADYARAFGTNEAYRQASLADNEADYQRALAINEQNLGRSLSIAEQDALRSLVVQDRNRLRALDEGIGATGNYIDRIATPRAQRELVLAGLESSGAVPDAIARATAEYALPYISSIENTYGTNQAGTLNNLMGIRAGLTGDVTKLDAALAEQLLQLQTGINTNTSNQQANLGSTAMEGNRGTGQARMAGATQIGGNYQSNITQLATAMMNNNITLEQAGIAADSALGQQLIQAQQAIRQTQANTEASLGNTYGTNRTNFVQTLPATSEMLTLAPYKAQAAKNLALTALMPIADFPRQLRESDYNRRQGLFTTMYTGIPYTPGSTTFGGTATGNIFDQLGGTIQSGFKGGGNIGG